MPQDIEYSLVHASNRQLVVKIANFIEIPIIEVLKARRNTTEHGWELFNFVTILLQRILKHLTNIGYDWQKIFSEIFFLLSAITHIQKQFKNFLLCIIVEKVYHVESLSEYAPLQDIFWELLANFFTRLNALLDEVHVAHRLFHSLLNRTDYIDTH